MWYLGIDADRLDSMDCTIVDTYMIGLNHEIKELNKRNKQGSLDSGGMSNKGRL